MKKTFLACIVLILGLGCTTTPEQQSLLQNQVFSLRQVQKKQTQAQQDIQDRLAELEQRLQELSTQTQDTGGKNTQAVLSSQADIASKVESQQVKLATLMGAREDMERSLQAARETGVQNAESIAVLEERLAVLEKDLHMVISQLGIKESAEAPATSQPPKPDDTADTAQASQTITPDFLYDQALQAFNQRDYTKALGLWSDMVDGFPEHELVPNAYFWKGEAYYQLQDFAKAALQYNTVIEQYPKSNKYPAALLKQGLSYYALDKNRAGRLRLEELIKKFPNRAEAKRAQVFLDNR